MSESKRLANELRKALNGEAWHGPSWKDVLDGVGREAAVCRPIPDAHTIAEVAAHAAAWNDIVLRRLRGELPQVSDSENWPPSAFADDAAWSAATKRLFETGEKLAQTIDGFPEAKLHEKRPKVDGTWYELISGQLQHTLYHAGQVGLLKKAKVPAGAM
ncbi:MAG: DinB family protein [Candidatus Eiseniibacteriota bacterium]